MGSISSQADKPIEIAVAKSHAPIVKHLFEMKEVQDRYKDNDTLMSRLCISLFAFSSDYIIDYVLPKLKIGKDKVAKLMSHKCETSTWVLFDEILTDSVKNLKRFVDFVGKDAFVDHLLKKSTMDLLFANNRLKTEYLLSFKEIRDKYMSNDVLLFELIKWMDEVLR